MNEVFDAETGEKLELFVHSPDTIDETTSSRVVVDVDAASFCYPSASPPRRQQQLPSPTQLVHPETQSLRLLGSHVDWEQQQATKVEKADQCFRESLAGVRHELQRSGLSETARLNLTAELLEKTKRGYATHVQTLVVEELAREMNREVMLRLELAPLGRERMQRRHDKERAFYRAQIARVREECEMALTFAAAKNNLLR